MLRTINISNKIIDSYKNNNGVSFLNFVIETGERIKDLKKFIFTR